MALKCPVKREAQPGFLRFLASVQALDEGRIKFKQGTEIVSIKDLTAEAQKEYKKIRAMYLKVLGKLETFVPHDLELVKTLWEEGIPLDIKKINLDNYVKAKEMCAEFASCVENFLQDIARCNASSLTRVKTTLTATAVGGAFGLVGANVLAVAAPPVAAVSAFLLGLLGYYNSPQGDIQPVVEWLDRAKSSSQAVHCQLGEVEDAWNEMSKSPSFPSQVEVMDTSVEVMDTSV